MEGAGGSGGGGGESQVKRRADDCDMVGTLESNVLTRNELCFLEAARNDDDKIVKKILKKRAAHVDCRNNLDRTALHLAAAKGHVKMIQLLIIANATIDATDRFGMTPLLWAAYYGHEKAVELLNSRGAAIKKTNKQGMGILHIIAETDHYSIYDWIRRKGKRVKIDATDSLLNTPLLMAATNGSINMLERLLDAECDVTKVEKNRRSALHLAAKGKHVECLKKLLEVPELQEMINDADSTGNTCLHFAALSGSVEVVQEILKIEHVEVNKRAENNMTALMFAAKGNHDEIVQALLDHGAESSARNIHGNTALHMAAMANHPKTCAVLLDAGAPIDQINIRYQSPLLCAVEQNKLEAAEVLLLYGANCDLIDKLGKTPLLLAARNGSLAMVDLIIKSNRLRMRRKEAEERAAIRDQEEEFKVHEAQLYEDDNNENQEDKEEDSYFDTTAAANEEIPQVYNIHSEEVLEHDFYKKGYRLAEFNQIYAEEFKVYLWRLAFKHLRLDEWKKLGQYWGFTPEELMAIEYQQSGDYSYKQQSYRLLCIWFHGLDVGDTPIRQLYEALVAIGRHKLAHQIRSELDPTKSSTCTIL